MARHGTGATAARRARSRPSDAREPGLPRIAVARGVPLDGDWLWTCRAGAERDVVDEIELALGRGRAQVAGPALVRSRGAPTSPEGSLDLTFARQGLRVVRQVSAGDLVAACAEALEPIVRSARPWALSAWVPDTAEHNPLAPLAAEIEARVAAALEARSVPGRVALTALPRAGALLAQVVLVAAGRAVVGAVATHEALTLAPGGRARMRVGAGRPSRAARKLEEAFAWLGLAPEPGERCVDLGAAPGGWSWVLLERRARVIAVDPAALRRDLIEHPGLVHHRTSAFRFAPDEPVDWLFCDMAWRPLEVARLLAKWGRRRWARLLVANLKLPMKKKALTVQRLRTVIASGGWRRIRTRQLYHDRDEITLIAHR